MNYKRFRSQKDKFFPSKCINDIVIFYQTKKAKSLVRERYSSWLWEKEHNFWWEWHTRKFYFLSINVKNTTTSFITWWILFLKQLNEKWNMNEISTFNIQIYKLHSISNFTSPSNLCYRAIEQSCSKINFISGLSSAGKMHLSATWSMLSRIVCMSSSLLCFPSKNGSKHSIERSWKANNLAHSVKSSTSEFPGTISAELLPVKSSNKITPKA